MAGQPAEDNLQCPDKQARRCHAGRCVQHRYAQGIPQLADQPRRLRLAVQQRLDADVITRADVQAQQSPAETQRLEFLTGTQAARADDSGKQVKRCRQLRRPQAQAEFFPPV